MSDLVDRLRFLASGQDDPQSVALQEAAAEIERLTLDVKHWQSLSEQHLTQAFENGGKANEARAEIERLRVDAERWRFLRDSGYDAHAIFTAAFFNTVGPDALDAAIDAARSAHE